jgi:hypothetical protein
MTLPRDGYANKRADAILLGDDHYMTGKPCPRGHVGPRRVSDRSCIDCERARTAARMSAKAPSWLE